MNGKGSSTQDRQGIFQKQAAATSKWGSLLRWAFTGLAAGMMVVGLHPPADAAVFTLDNACDVLIKAPKGADAAVISPKLIEATPGTIVMLTGDSLCEPVIGGSLTPRKRRPSRGWYRATGSRSPPPG